jgi:hypothetical protein
MTPIQRSSSIFACAALLAFTPHAWARTPQQPAPDDLFAPPGTVITIQIRDYLSSSRNSSGDTFAGTLQQPLVIDGWVVARPGQTVMGQVVAANSAGRVKGTSDLAVELSEITLVDGRQIPIRTQMLRNYGRDSHAEDAAAIAGSTALGAVIGAAAGQGKGALIGASIGAGAATVGVLSTRGKATEIYPESTLTFRLDAPLMIATDRSRQAFVAVAATDYQRSASVRGTGTVRIPPRNAYPMAAPYPLYPPPIYPPFYAPYARYPSVVVVTPIVIGNGSHDRRHRR